MVRRPLQVGRKPLFDPPSTLFLTEIELVGSGAKRRRSPPPPMAGYISHHVFSSASLSLLVVVRGRRIANLLMCTRTNSISLIYRLARLESIVNSNFELWHRIDIYNAVRFAYILETNIRIYLDQV